MEIIQQELDQNGLQLFTHIDRHMLRIRIGGNNSMDPLRETRNEAAGVSGNDGQLFEYISALPQKTQGDLSHLVQILFLQVFMIEITSMLIDIVIRMVRAWMEKD